MGEGLGGRWGLPNWAYFSLGRVVRPPAHGVPPPVTILDIVTPPLLPSLLQPQSALDIFSQSSCSKRRHESLFFEIGNLEIRWKKVRRRLVPLSVLEKIFWRWEHQGHSSYNIINPRLLQGTRPSASRPVQRHLWFPGLNSHRLVVKRDYAPCSFFLLLSIIASFRKWPRNCFPNTGLQSPDNLTFEYDGSEMSRSPAGTNNSTHVPADIYSDLGRVGFIPSAYQGKNKKNVQQIPILRCYYSAVFSILEEWGRYWRMREHWWRWYSSLDTFASVTVNNKQYNLSEANLFTSFWCGLWTDIIQLLTCFYRTNKMFQPYSFLLSSIDWLENYEICWLNRVYYSPTLGVPGVRRQLG